MKRACRIALVAFALTLGGTGFAEAADYGLHGGLPWFGYGYSGSLYGLGRIPVPPYYALHPPVYYSQPVARPYGHSPFAWRAPQAAQLAPAPTVTLNPYYKPETEPAQSAAEERTARAMVNQHFVAGRQQAPE